MDTNKNQAALIQLVDVAKTFHVNGVQIRAVDGISLDIHPGEIFGMIGHSGAGKSTAIRLINLLERPDCGKILIDGVEINALNPADLRAERRKIGMIFQHFNLLYAKTIFENVALPLRIAGVASDEFIKNRVSELLKRVGLEDQTDKYPSQLSGGQKQRVGIARALATEPKILLCDEATSALDPQTTQSVLRLLAEINEELNLTIILITHEMNVIRTICDRVAILEAGKIVEMGEVADVFLHPKHPTTKRFVMESEQISESDQEDDFSHATGKIVRITFRGQATYEPILSKIMRECDADFSILAGRIDHIKNMPYGQLTLAINSNTDNVAQILQRLNKEDLRLEELR